MKSFRRILKIAEPKVHIPILKDNYDELEEDIKDYIEDVWPELAEWALIDMATDINCKLFVSSPVQQKMYLALYRRFISDFINYPEETSILVGKKFGEISDFLKTQKQKSFYNKGVADYEIDIFICVNVNVTESQNGSLVRVPYFVGIMFDEYYDHEKSEKQIKKDKSFDKALKMAGLNIIRFPWEVIKEYPDKCAEIVWKLKEKNFHEIDKIVKEDTKIFTFPEKK